MDLFAELSRLVQELDGARRIRSVQRSMLAVASLMPMTPGTSARRSTVSFCRSATAQVSSTTDRRRAASSTPGVTHAPAAYCYRCPLGLTYPSCNIACAREVEDIIKYNTSGKIAAFIAEPIQGFGGCVTPPKEYFEIVYDIVHRYGGVCISDEVQTGFGRTGDKWWGIEQWGVKPDMITMAKGITNAAVVLGRFAAAEVNPPEQRGAAIKIG